MKKVLRFCCFLLILFPFSLYSQSDEVKKFIQDCNQTGNFIFYILEKTANPLISPFSIYSALLISYCGAKGETARQIEKALGIDSSREDLAHAYSGAIDHLTEGIENRNFAFSVGNGMWVDRNTSILSDFRSLMTGGFKGTAESVNFQKPQDALKKINGWVREKTHGKIPNFLLPSDLTSSTKMILTNTLFLKGHWQNPFETQKTGVQNFLTGKSTQSPVQMITQTTTFPYFESKKTQVIALPLASGGSEASYALVLFLPRNQPSSLFDFYYQQDEEAPQGFLSYLDHLQPQRVEITMPKFNIDQKISLNAAFQTMGITDAFSYQADFSGIDGKKDLFISKALHECTISVGEGGVFAGATSGITFDDIASSLLDMETPIKFLANRPFLFALMEMNAKCILFIGECTNPTPVPPQYTEEGKK